MPDFKMNCQHCGIEFSFHRKPARYFSTKGNFRHFCDKCKNVRNREPIDQYVDIHGYVFVRNHNNTKEFISEHRLVMSQKLGRPLIKGESVHHKNGIRSDNRPENLELWVG